MPKRNVTQLRIEWSNDPDEFVLVEVNEGTDIHAVVSGFVAELLESSDEDWWETSDAIRALLGWNENGEQEALAARGVRIIDTGEDLTDCVWRPDLAGSIHDEG